MRTAIATTIMIMITICGCMSFFNDNDSSLFSKNSLREITGAQLQNFVGQCDGHVLVEFGMDSNCDSCQFMQPDVTELAKKYNGLADIVHVDYVENRELVSRFGGTACPTYVLFEKGEPDPVFIKSYPISKDNLEAELLAVLAFSTD
jgi:thiol-disulfide isomerase/thioredoxin